MTSANDRTTILTESHREAEPRLIVVAGEGPGREFPLGSRPFTVGRDAGCDLVLADEQASRVHARFMRTDSGWAVQDLQSRNGISVNRRRVTDAPLRHGDEIQIGRSVIRFLASPVGPTSGLALRNWAAVGGVGVGVLAALFWFSRSPSPPTAAQTALTATRVSPAPVVASVAASSAAPPTASVSREVVRRYEMGMAYYDAGRLPDAIREWEAALRGDPGHGPSRHKLEKAREEVRVMADSHYRVGVEDFKYLRYEKAIQEWELVTRLIADPGDPRHRQAKEEIERARQKLAR